MQGIKNLLFGIGLLIVGLYGLIWTDLLYLTVICGPLGFIYCLYGFMQKK